MYLTTYIVEVGSAPLTATMFTPTEHKLINYCHKAHIYLLIINFAILLIYGHDTNSYTLYLLTNCFSQCCVQMSRFTKYAHCATLENVNNKNLMSVLESSLKTSNIS